MNEFLSHLFLIVLSSTQCSGWTLSTSYSSIITQRTQQIRLSTTNDSQAPASLPASPLSFTFEELSFYLGGKGRAQSCWELYRLGVDPLWFYNDTKKQEEESNHGGLLTNPGWTRERLQLVVKTQMMGTNAIHRLAQLYTSDSTTLCHINRSNDGTTKLLLKLKDGLEIETVIIPWEDRQRSTLCISSQVGCRQACVFCATGRMGILRSLTSDEILSQVYWANKVCRVENILPVDNIVFMGMGEPADNVPEVVRAANQLVDRNLFALSGKRVTISTVAPTPQAFADLAQAPVTLAWSVHASHDNVRKALVPTTRFTMLELREGLLSAMKGRSRSLQSIMLEVTLLNGINDNEHDALDLVEFSKPLIAAFPKLLVNLIPWNTIGASSGWAKDFQQPSMKRLSAFQQVLTTHGVLCRIRTTRGDDESSACGQLATNKKILK